MECAIWLISIKETKNGANRVIPASNRAAETLSELAHNNTYSLFPLSGNAVNLSLQRLKRRTSLNWLRFHDFRHEAISRLVEVGLSLPEIQLISGHKTTQQLLDYTHVNVFKIRAKLNATMLER